MYSGLLVGHRVDACIGSRGLGRPEFKEEYPERQLEHPKARTRKAWPTHEQMNVPLRSVLGAWGFGSESRSWCAGLGMQALTGKQKSGRALVEEAVQILRLQTETGKQSLGCVRLLLLQGSPQTRNLKPLTLNPKPLTLNPKPLRPLKLRGIFGVQVL